jgi:MAF protein
VSHTADPPSPADARAAPGLPDLILASASPRRAELLTRVGLRFRVVPADVDETPLPEESAGEYARRVCADKLAAVAARLDGQPEAALPLLAADTIVVLDRAILGKPSGPEEAADMLRRLAGRRHDVVTAYRAQRGAAVAEDDPFYVYHFYHHRLYHFYHRSFYDRIFHRCHYNLHYYRCHFHHILNAIECFHQ